LIRLFSILILVVVSSFAKADTKTYGVVHIGLTKTNITGSLQIKDRSSYVGLKGVSVLNTELYATYKFEIGVDLTNHSSEHLPKVNYSFIGLKSKFGELRLGIQDSAYDVVDNSMENFLTEQGNGLITESESAKLISFITKISPIGIYSTHIPSLEGSKASSSMMINYASGPLYAGVAVKKEDGRNKKEGFKLVTTYKKNNLKLGYIHEKCLSEQNRVAVKGECTGAGEGRINHVSVAYSFDQSYIAAQFSRNSHASINKHTIEFGYVLGRDTKAYIEFDKVDNFRSTTIGLKTHF